MVKILIEKSFSITVHYVTQLHTVFSVNEALISEFKAAADHYGRSLCDCRPLLIQSQTLLCLCLSVSVLPRLLSKHKTLTVVKQSVHFAALIFSQRTTACILPETTPGMQQLCPLTNCNCPLLIDS